MKGILFLYVLMLAAAMPATAQTGSIAESLMTRHRITCDDVTYNASLLIPECYAKGQKDTLQAVMKYWEEHCGPTEAVMRCKIILSIDGGAFSERIYEDVDIIPLLQEYGQNNTLYDGKPVRWGSPYRDRYEQQGSERLAKFTMTLADTLLKREGLTPVEKFFLRVYSGDSEQALLSLKDSGDLNGTAVMAQYLRQGKPRIAPRNYNNDWMLGLWIPSGDLGILGVHPFVGYRIGRKNKKITADVTFGIKFCKSPNTYQVYDEGRLMDTDHFAGLYAGIDAGYELFRFGKSGIELVGGYAFENICTLNEPADDSDGSHERYSMTLNTNIGLGYRFHFKNRRYAGVDIKYNMTRFTNPGGTSLEGDTFTVNLILGNVWSAK
jgi:hypothetical protein